MRTRFLIVLALLAAAPARADLTMMMRVRAFGQPAQTVTVRQSGPKTRTDSGPVSFVIDASAKTVTLIDRTRRAVSVRPYDGKEILKPGDVSATVVKTNRRQTILGHPARLFTARGLSLGAKTSAQIWAAEDMARPVIPTLFNGADSNALLKGIHGLPLRTLITVRAANGPTVTLSSDVSYLSTAPVPAAAFAVPDGYISAPEAPTPAPVKTPSDADAP